jgi:ADP-dependent NAD(P)H-hydrate dehydratase
MATDPTHAGLGDRLANGDPPRLPRRDPRGHKGTFGTVLVIGGCAAEPRMIGAPALAALAALRSGCGLVKILAPEPILNHAIALCPSATGWGIQVDEERRIVAHEGSRGFDRLANDANAIVVGPGLGDGPGVARMALRAIQHEECPVILDAEAINALAAIPELHRDWKCAGVITPHPGEFRRLASAMKIEADPTSEKTRPTAAEELAQKLGCIVVLKGAGTVVSDGHRTWVNTTGGPELATAGTGDVLAGLIAGIVAQHVRWRVPRLTGSPVSRGSPMDADVGRLRELAKAKRRERGLEVPASVSRDSRVPPLLASAPRTLDLFDATRIAVMVHGLAGERWREMSKSSGGMLAMELINQLPAIVEQWRGPVMD